MRLDGYDKSISSPAPDEHGQKIQQTGVREGNHARASWSIATCRSYCAMAERLNCSNDDFIRTHGRASPSLVAGHLGFAMAAKGDIYLVNMPAGIGAR